MSGDFHRTPLSWKASRETPPQSSISKYVNLVDSIIIVQIALSHKGSLGLNRCHDISHLWHRTHVFALSLASISVQGYQEAY